MRNTNAVFTARCVAPNLPIVATADQPAAAEALRLAGSTRVLEFHEMLAQALARRVRTGHAKARIVGRFDELVIAEAPAAGTPFTGRPLGEVDRDGLADVSVVGLWERGQFQVAGPMSEIGVHAVLVLAGTTAAIRAFDERYGQANALQNGVVVIVGGGRVGRATAKALATRGIEACVVEQVARAGSDEGYVIGDASQLETLERAGIAKAPALVLTTHDDDLNVFLALLCRKLWPDVQVLSRATFEKNVETLHRAGTDFVLSMASMGSAAIFNQLGGGDTVTLSEGLDLFRVPIPAQLVGHSLIEADLRQRTGCQLIALQDGDDLRLDPDPRAPLPAGSEAILIGARESEARFFEIFGGGAPARPATRTRPASPAPPSA